MATASISQFVYPGWRSEVLVSLIRPRPFLLRFVGLAVLLAVLAVGLPARAQLAADAGAPPPVPAE